MPVKSSNNTIKNSDDIDGIITLIQEKTSDRFTKSDGQILEDRQWKIIQRISSLEKKSNE